MYVCVHESLERFFVVTFMNKYIALRYKSRSDVFIAFLYIVYMLCSLKEDICITYMYACNLIEYCYPFH